MACRQFEAPEHANLYRKFRKRPPSTLIERILLYLKEQHVGPLGQAVDLGCGSGQCSFLLAEYFENVLAIDVSPAQINEAIKQKEEEKATKLHFRVSPAEKMELPDSSVDLITACTAAHWFDLPKVYAEGRRVLRPNGVMAFFCQEGFVIELADESASVNSELTELMEKANEALRMYYAPPVQHWYNKYRDIVIPYRDLVREYGHGFEDNEKVSLSAVLGFFKTFSAFQNICQQEGLERGEIFLNTVQRDLMKVANMTVEDMDKEIFTLRNPYMLVMARL